MQPLYPYALGLFIALAFSFVLGFGATFAEPPLRGKRTHARTHTHHRTRAHSKTNILPGALRVWWL
jgi:hypothetical protein